LIVLEPYYFDVAMMKKLQFVISFGRWLQDQSCARGCASWFAYLREYRNQGDAA
jgi:hypothetical protein